MRKRNILAAVGACLAVAALISPSASADPPPATDNRLLAGVGSDTTENVLNDFANGRSNPAFAGIPTLASWNTLPLNGPITTKDPIAGTTPCTFPRPFGSTAGVQSLIDQRNLAAAEGGRRSCVDFARSSSNSSAAFPGSGLTYVPFAVDGLTYATPNNTNRPTTLTQAQLQAIYRCDVPGFRPLLPQAGSGTRSTWLGFVGVSNADAVARTAAAGTAIQDGNPDAAVQRCLTDTVPVAGDVAGSVPLTESVGNVLDDARQILPYSIAQLRAQQSGAIVNDSGTVQGRRVNGIIPDLDDRAFPFRRLVFNVIPTQFEGNADYTAVFGSAGTICANPTVIRVNGFAPIVSGDPLLGAAAGCGDFAIRSTGPGVVTGPPAL